MSYQIGMSAINLEMPPRVPRTEYSAELYFDLMQVVTGIPVHSRSTDEEKLRASQVFRKAWNYDFRWNTMVGGDYAFHGMRTKMGHAVFAQNGIDYTKERSVLFTDPEDVLDFDPCIALGPVDIGKETRMFDAHYRKQCELFPEEVNMTGIYVSCVSGLIDLFGWEMLLYAAGLEPRRFGDMAVRYSSWVGGYFSALAQSDVPVVMIHDDLVWTQGPFIHPSWYREYVFPHLKENLRPLCEAGKKILFTCDGNYNCFIDDFAGLGIHGFVLEPLTDLKYIAEKYGKTHVIIGNADTRIIMMGNKENIFGEVKRCMDTCKKTCPGFFMAIGNHISSNCPVENLLYYNEVVEQWSRR